MPFRDASLPHQIVLVYDKQHNAAVRVSCNCLGTEHRNRTVNYDLMPGFPKNTPQALAIYQNPDNHRMNQGVAYGPEEELRGH